MAKVLVVAGKDHVLVDDDIAHRLSNRRWLRMGGRIVCMEDHSFGRMMDLAEEIGGVGAVSASTDDYRRHVLRYTELDDECRAIIRRLLDRAG